MGETEGEDHSQILKKFEDFCTVDLGLANSTTHVHVKNSHRFLQSIDKSLLQVDSQDLRNYLRGYLDTSLHTRANQVKSLRRFFRDFLNSGHLVESFKMPKNGFVPKVIPTKQELQRFYQALDNIRDKALFLFIATSGIRKGEALSLELSDIDLKKRMVIPRSHRRNNSTKNSWVSFYNEEANTVLHDYLATKDDSDFHIFSLSGNTNLKTWRKAGVKTDVHVTPQVLRNWFCSEKGSLGVPDRYVDAFCGRTPKSILARHYTDYSPKRLKEIYDKANLRVIS